MTRKNNIFFGTIGLIFLISVLIFGNPVLDKTIIKSTFHLTEYPGFDHVTGELRFGGIPINNSASRNLEIKNTFDRPILISIESRGEIVNHIIVSENNFHLEPNQVKNVSFAIYTSGLTEYKEYFGDIIIVSKKV